MADNRVRPSAAAMDQPAPATSTSPSPPPMPRTIAPLKQSLGVAAVELQQGFVLTRHWRDTPAGTEVEFWLATDDGPRHLRLPCQPSVAFMPAAQREQAEALLRGERDVELRPLALRDFHQRPVLGLY